MRVPHLSNNSDDSTGGDYFKSAVDLLVGFLFLFIIALALSQQTLDSATQDLQAAKASLESAYATRTFLLEAIKEQLRLGSEECKVSPNSLAITVDADAGILRFPETNSEMFPSNGEVPTEHGRKLACALGYALEAVLPCYADASLSNADRRRDILGKLKAKCEELRRGNPTYQAKVAQVLFEGHADDRSTDKSNFVLSTTRSVNALRQALAGHSDDITSTDKADRALWGEALLSSLIAPSEGNASGGKPLLAAAGYGAFNEIMPVQETHRGLQLGAIDRSDQREVDGRRKANRRFEVRLTMTNSVEGAPNWFAWFSQP